MLYFRLRLFTPIAWATPSCPLRLQFWAMGSTALDHRAAQDELPMAPREGPWYSSCELVLEVSTNLTPPLRGPTLAIHGGLHRRSSIAGSGASRDSFLLGPVRCRRFRSALCAPTSQVGRREFTNRASPLAQFNSAAHRCLPPRPRYHRHPKQKRRTRRSLNRSFWNLAHLVIRTTNGPPTTDTPGTRNTGKTGANTQTTVTKTAQPNRHTYWKRRLARPPRHRRRRAFRLWRR